MLKVAMPFSNHMVLQRNKEIAVWGTADVNAIVAVGLEGGNGVLKRVETSANQSGQWKCFLPAFEAMKNLTLVVESGKDRVEFCDVCVGEVWLAGGQSNMEYLMGFEEHYDELLAGELPNNVRFFNTPQVASELQRKELNYSNDGFWRCCTKEDLGWFSAIGYYFSKELSETLDVPVGILGCNWGGTNCCTWMNPEYLRGTKGECWLELNQNIYGQIEEEVAYEAFKKTGGYERTDMLHEAFGNMAVKHSLTKEEQQAFIEQQEMNFESDPFMELPYERRPGCLYETMVKQLIPYSIRGVIWYQGESDSGYPLAYRDVFEGLVKNWRHEWGEELPFIYAQLAPFYRWLGCTADGYVELREAQELISKTVSYCYMASNGDAGMEWDIHPKNKVPVAHRMALLARKKVYGEDVMCDAPEIKTVEKCGSQVIITFKNGDGLEVAGSKINALACWDEAGQLHEPKSFCVEGNQLILEVEQTAGQMVSAVSLAKEHYYKINLYNQAGIPALPFFVKIK